LPRKVCLEPIKKRRAFRAAARKRHPALTIDVKGYIARLKGNVSPLVTRRYSDQSTGPSPKIAGFGQKTQSKVGRQDWRQALRLIELTLIVGVAFGVGIAHAAEIPRDAVVLPGHMAAELLHQCSRKSPTVGESTWQPSADDILKLEALLPNALMAQAAKGDPDWSVAPSGWRRQYVGIVLNSRRLIYGNFVLKGVDPGPWRTNPVMVCDGGPRFFGVVYDVAAGRITDLAFNGAI
jgi:hypothetical protein